ncbi:MAG TPA: tetratricopeptide repeat protein [Candidatus Hydrogenedentes bacterium]|nr:tetratricopeptide repeat protein [Candidatus Hydrogenedentota bacterium]HPG68470.1 tetratricopeptide repeat protein [Candidatus Hydrogenedentota bacterium]
MTSASRSFGFLSVVVAVVGVACVAVALEKGDIAPSFTATDIHGQKVDLDQIIAQSPDMVILYFFTIDGGQEIALRLSTIHSLYGRDKVRTIAFGIKEQEEALKAFADELQIEYYLLPESQLDANEVYGPIRSLPLTVILKNDKRVIKLIRGGGEAAASVLTGVAETFLQQGNTDEAVAVADKAKEEGEPAAKAAEVKGFALTAAGKLDEAEEEFGAIECKEGLAKVALERTDYTKAIELADEAPDHSGYADTIKATALMRSGKLEEAAPLFESGAQKSTEDWKASEAVTGQGRLLQEQGNLDDAIVRYDEAVALDPYNIIALSNEGAAYRIQGDLDKAAGVLEEAKKVGDDELVAVMLRQVQRELEEANDVRRGELIRAQIADLSKRYDEMKAAGTDKPVDPWSTRPLVVAFLPSENKTPVFFERAGTDIALRRELEASIQSQGCVKVVDREMLDKLLQELNLGTSELASQDTQLQLGKLLSARYLGFVDFAQAGPDTLMYVRLVDTETTSIALQLMRNLKDAEGIAALARGVADEMMQKVIDGRELKGLIADATSEEAIMINLGKAHGVEVGQHFTILEEGEPIEVGGRVIAYRPKPIGLLEVTEVEDAYAVCKVVKKNEGVQLAKEMKVKVAKAQ